MLASRPLAWIGLISYPLYLWHWPLLVFGATIKFAPLTLLERELVLVASVLLSWATYRFVEKPIRFGRPSSLLLHGTWERHLDNVAETVAALKRQTRARVVVLGPLPFWRRSVPNEVMRYYMLHHTLVPPRLDGVARSDSQYDNRMREKLVPLGAEFISAREVMCNAEGCLIRVGDGAADIIISDQAHLTEKGSAFLIDAIIDRVLTPPASDRK